MLGVARPSANVATNQSTTGTSFSNAEFWGMDQDGEISHSVSGDRDDWTWRDGGPLNPGGIRQGGGYVGYQVRGWCYPFQGEGDGEWFGNGDVMRLLLDADAGTLTAKKNGTLLGVAVTNGLTGDLCWVVAMDLQVAARCASRPWTRRSSEYSVSCDITMDLPFR